MSAVASTAFPPTPSSQVDLTNVPIRPSLVKSISPAPFGAARASIPSVPAFVYADQSDRPFMATDYGNVRFVPAPYGNAQIGGFADGTPQAHYAKALDHLRVLYQNTPEYTFMKYANQRNQAQRKNFETRNLGTLVGRPAVPNRGDLRVKVKDAKMQFDPGFMNTPRV